MDEGNCFVLLSLIEDNVDHFEGLQTEYGQRFSQQFSDLHDAVTQLRGDCILIGAKVHLYDFDVETPGNGYRTSLTIVNRFLPVCIKLCRHVISSRASMFFRTDFYHRELDAHLSVVAGMQVSAQFLLRMLDAGPRGDLFVSEKVSIRELLEEYGTLPQVGFYGRLAGFYFCESMRRIITGLNVVMASFSDQYLQSGGALAHAAASLINCGKYALNPEARASHIVDVTQSASLDFLKAFWSLNEGDLLRKVPQWLCPSLEVVEVLNVPAEQQTLLAEDGVTVVNIPIPSSHKPMAPVRCRLLSYHQRKGQESLTGKKWLSNPLPASNGLLLHCHGGGFVSQTPDSHEIYLRDWAKDLDVPILTVDYSLSPEAPFPRALEEVLHVYAWALCNCEKLGWTGRDICVAGDSAGGNLVLALSLKTIDLNIRRPTGVFAAYTPVMLNMTPSPSRILCAVDPLLPLGFMLTCLHAYIGRLNEDESPLVSPSFGTKSPPVSPDSGVLLVSSPSAESQCPEGFQDSLETSAPDKSLQPEEKSTTIQAPRPKQPLARTKNVLQLEASGELPTQFLTRFTSSCDDAIAAYADEGRREDYMVLEMPTDLAFALRHRCCQTTSRWLQALLAIIGDNRFYQKHIVANWELLCGQKGRKRQGLTVPWFRRPSRLDRKFQTMKILSSNPFISPYLAPEWMLQKMPPCYFVGLHLDPTLDDLVMFSKRLKTAQRFVHLEILDYLPHAFLNFLPFSKEAHEGSRVCIRLIKQSFGISP
ncbi:unnamed protein product [Ixodes persulcatus]